MVAFLVSQKVIIGIIIIVIGLLSSIKPFSKKDYKTVAIIMLVAAILAAIAFGLDQNGGILRQIGDGITNKVPKDPLN